MITKKNNYKSKLFPDFDVPMYDYLEHFNLNDHGDLERLMEDLTFDLENGYFLRWEAVVCEEQGLPLTDKQEEALSEIISFDEEDDDRILYIDEIPRPSEPWYEIVRKIAKHLLLDEFRTFNIHFVVTTEGWAELVEVIEEYGIYLSLPEGIKSPIDVVPTIIQHKLWIQWCFEELNGIGQEEEITLENKQQHFRIDEFIDRLKECKESVQYLDLTLQKMLSTLILPQKDERIFIEQMIKKLGLSSVNDHIADFL